MTDNLSPEDRIKTMRAVKGRGTTLERKLFATLAGMHIHGWKKNVREIEGKPDIVFLREKIAIFIDGCFWHGCPICNRKLPDTNQEYWSRKINRNIELASIHNQKLQEMGWKVIRVWEHEIKDASAMEALKVKIRVALKEGADEQASRGNC